MNKRLILQLILLIILILAPQFLLSSYHLFRLTLVAAYAIVVLGLNLLMGYNGQFSLGHSSFFAIGAYLTAIMIPHLGPYYLLAIPCSAVISLLVGLIIGIPAIRFHGIYLAIVTLTLAVATPQIIKFLEPWTSGAMGINLDKPSAPNFLPLNPDQWIYFLTILITIFLFYLARNLIESRVGRAIIAIHDNPIAASTLGVNISAYKIMVFGVSVMYASIAGSLAALILQFVAPDVLTFELSIYFVIGVIVGGVRSLWGPIYGAFYIVFLPNIANAISKGAPEVISGLILILLLIFLPEGIHGGLRKIYVYLQQKRYA